MGYWINRYWFGWRGGNGATPHDKEHTVMWNVFLRFDPANEQFVVEVHYNYDGADDRALLLLAGFPLERAAWAYAESVADSYALIARDRRT